MKTSRWRTIALAALCIGLLNCGPEVEPFGEAALVLHWDVAPMGCEAAEVDEIHMVLQNERQTYRQRFGCERNPAEVDGVAPGTYDLLLSGRVQGQQDGPAAFGATVSDVLVQPDSRTETDVIDLVAVPGELTVQWAFSSARTCAANAVDAVEIAVFDTAHHEIERIGAFCDEQSTQIGELNSGTYLVRVRASGPHRDYEGFGDAELDRGDHTEVTVELNPVSDR